MSPQGLSIFGSKIPTSELVRVLAMILDRPVVDKTEFTGEFDLKLSFTPDELTSGLPGGGGPRAIEVPRFATDDSRPGIMSALQEQLGLKLMATKAPVEVLVIDHVERPTAN